MCVANRTRARKFLPPFSSVSFAWRLSISLFLSLSSAHARNSKVIFRLGFLVAYGHEEQSSSREGLSVREASVEDAVVTNSWRSEKQKSVCEGGEFGREERKG